MQEIRVVFLLLLSAIACQTTRHVSTIDNDVYYLHTNKGEVSDRLVKILQEMRDALSLEHARLPNDTRTLFNLAQVHFLLEDFDNSAKYCRKLLQLDFSSVQAKSILVKIFLKQERYELAQMLVQQLGESASAYNLKAQIHVATHEYQQAMQTLSFALNEYPNDTSLLMNLGLLYLRFRQLHQARGFLERVLAQVRDHPDAMLHLAVLDSARGNYQQAEGRYRLLLTQRGKDPNVLFNLLILKNKTLAYQEAASLLVKYGMLWNGDDWLHEAGKRFLRDFKAQLERNEKITEDEIKRISVNIKR